MLRNNKQNRELHVLLTKAGISHSTEEGREVIKDMVYRATNGRTESTKLLNIEECQALINGLRVQLGPKAFKRAAGDDNADKMRKTCLSRCREMGAPWYQNGQYNWEKINAWLFKYGYLHKALNAYSEKELPKLITQFDQLLKTHYANK